MKVVFRVPITEEYPNVEGACAATVDISQERVECAIRELKSAITYWREGEADSSVSSGERQYRAERIARLQMEFGSQWANVKRILENK